ncbi:MAG TPA: undecaprenyl-diphosphate phosphatase [Planctomycetota bacterium]|nr:undecaprenyl-diphosphate phosphatase [Planctomycetota bacterium]
MSLAVLLVLAVIQGLTEFLPVSSDGHLALGRLLLGGTRTGLVVELTLHAGTLIPILVGFGSDWLGIARAPFGRDEEAARKGRRLFGLLVLGTIPAALAGVLLKDWIESLYPSARAVGGGLLANAVVLAFGARAARSARRDFDSVGAADVLVVGLAQAFALLPGVSRSGVTVTTALARGIAPASAARLSFLLAAPIIAGACALGAFDWARGKDVAEVGGGYLLIGAAVSAVVGAFGLRACLRLVVRNRLPWLAVYCAVAGLATVLFVKGSATAQ